MRQEDAALVKFLLEAGADVNAANEHGSTPLHYAAFLGPSLPNCSSKPAPGLTPKIATAKPPPSWQPSMGAKRCQRSSSKRPSHESGMFTRC
jgi:hypothetical protein